MKKKSRVRLGSALVVLRYALSAEYRRRKQTEIAPLCRELSLRTHAPCQLRIDIDVHGRRVVNGVILPFTGKTIFPNTFHFRESKTESSAKKMDKMAETNHLEPSLICEVVKEGRPEGAGTESQPYLK